MLPLDQMMLLLHFVAYYFRRRLNLSGSYFTSLPFISLFYLLDTTEITSKHRIMKISPLEK